MSTRSVIAVQTEDGIKAAYCHHDGYPSWVGYILLHHYNSQEQVEELVANGHMDSLHKTLESCVFHHRDWDRDWEKCKPAVHDTMVDFCETWCTFDREWAYLFRDGQWEWAKVYWSDALPTGPGHFEPLTESVADTVSH